MSGARTRWGGFLCLWSPRRFCRDSPTSRLKALRKRAVPAEARRADDGVGVVHGLEQGVALACLEQVLSDLSCWLRPWVSEWFILTYRTERKLQPCVTTAGCLFRTREAGNLRESKLRD